MMVTDMTRALTLGGPLVHPVVSDTWTVGLIA